MENNFEYTVYKHVGPTAKVYVGITKNAPQHRWGTNGSGYKGCPKFWNAIQKYGWGNFRHVILATGLTYEEAAAMEIELIEKYTGQNKTYNVMPGGNSYPIKHKPNGAMSDEQKLIRSKALKDRPKTPEHIEKVRQANLGKTVGYIWVNKDDKSARIPKEILYEYITNGWVLGRPSFTDAHRINISKGGKGRRYSKEYRENHSRIMKGKIKGFVNIQRGDKKTRIPASELDKYIAEGWERGWTLPKLIHITKGGVDRRIPASELDKYIAEGWERGRSFRHSVETKQKLSQYKPKWSPKSRAKVSATMKAKFR